MNLRTSLLLVVIGLTLFVAGSAHGLTTAQTVVIAGQALAGSDTLSNARVDITLVGAPCFTTTDLMPAVTITTYANSAGNWQKQIVGSDSISCVGGAVATYLIQIFSSSDVLKVTYSGLRIPATNGSTTQLRTIVASQ